MDGVYLLLGTNLGDRTANLDRVRELLIGNKVAIIKESLIYETAAWGIEDQPSFLNQVLEIETPKTPAMLLELTKAIEEDMGRVRKVKWGERLIDIDILYYGNTVMNQPNLIIPHPEIQNRRFTLVPLTEIASEFLHPDLMKSQQQLLEECTDQLGIKHFIV